MHDRHFCSHRGFSEVDRTLCLTLGYAGRATPLRPSTCVPDSACLLAHETAGHTKAQEVEPERRRDVEPIRRPADLRRAPPATATVHPARARIRALRIRLGAFASLTKKEINMDMAKEALKNFIQDKEAIITIDSIQKKVSTYFNLKQKDLRSKRRLKQLVVPRQIGMYLSRKLTNSSLIEIGEKFGGKDHSTVIHSLKKIEEKCNNDQYTKNVIADLIKEITG